MLHIGAAQFSLLRAVDFKLPIAIAMSVAAKKAKKFKVALPLAESIYRVPYRGDYLKRILTELIARPQKARMCF